MSCGTKEGRLYGNSGCRRRSIRGNTSTSQQSSYTIYVVRPNTCKKLKGFKLQVTKLVTQFHIDFGAGYDTGQLTSYLQEWFAGRLTCKHPLEVVYLQEPAAGNLNLMFNINIQGGLPATASCKVGMVNGQFHIDFGSGYDTGWLTCKNGWLTCKHPLQVSTVNGQF
ncbi:hypothetical protein B0H16DRAFT_1445706 [Mycena metata]|uniref:Uncharacterized protein n=1 Tax=Mycena metata TaxID=1033252 RepID=A0AAD7KH76_9AGAR|nr:hypothetical protein B0H16DRAFT_1445706 [Mycena metata]